MALTKIGATLGGSADVIQVTQNSHTLTLGYPVKMTASGYAHATADSAPNAEVVGIIIASTTNTLTIALGGRITVDGCVPNVTAGTVLFLQVSAGLLAAAEPSSAGQISKPMAVVTIANSEMIMVQQRGEVISTATASIADGSIDNDAMADDAIDSAELVAGSVDLAHMSVNSIDSDQYVDGSIDLAHMSVNSIDSDQYVDGSIDLAHMSVNSIDSDQYVDGSIDNIHLATGIDAVKLADGTVTNAELQHINTLSSNAQTQLTAKAPLASPVFTTSIRITPQSSAPGSPTTGTIYFDTEDNIAYVWNGSAWMALNAPPSFAATGGTETTYSGYKVHTFFVAGNSSSTNNFVVTGVAGNVDYLLVAGGGGGGGSYYAPGGGAGGVLTAGSLSLSVGSYTIVVGDGGDGGSAASPYYGNDGDDSTFNGLTAVGGGGGAHGQSYGNGRAGGSGGGAGASNNTNTAVGGTGVSGQGYAGGADTGSYLVAGGGGWGGAGGSGTNGTASNGGAGATNSYRTGSAVWYAAGGAGHQHGISTSTPYTTKQNSIGGAGSRHILNTEDLTQADAVAETGSGGGGSDKRLVSYTRAGNGSAGLVVIRYAV
jgi:hypothetical protein